MNSSQRKIDPVHVLAALLLVALTAGAAYLTLGVRPGPPAVLEAGGETLFLRGAWEIWLAWGLAAAGVALAAQVRRRPRMAALAVLPLAALGLWLALPALLKAEPETATFTSTTQLGEETRRTLLIGIDALSFDRLLPLVEAGRLPHFQRLMEEGSYGVLESMRTQRWMTDEIGFWSPVVWTTIATGVRETKHGIDDFEIQPDNGKRRMAMSYHRKAPAFWDIFSAFQRPAGVVGWWATHPAEEISGIMVSSSLGLRGHADLKHLEIDDEAWFQRRRRLTYPQWYQRVITEDIGLPQGMDDWFDEEIFPYRRVPVLEPKNLKTLLSITWQDRMYLDTLLHLLAHEKEMSLYAVYFEGVDVLNHRFWQYLGSPGKLADEAAMKSIRLPEGFDDHRQVVDRYYEVMDDYLGRMLEAAGEGATVIVVSDHGFRADPENPQGADHSPWGAILMRGPGIRAGQPLNLSLPTSVANLDEPVRVLDVLPTLLYLHGLPISQNLDGSVITRAFTRSFVSDRPMLTIPDYGDFESSREVEVEANDEEEYLRRMKSLGYIQ